MIPPFQIESASECACKMSVRPCIASTDALVCEQWEGAESKGLGECGRLQGRLSFALRWPGPGCENDTAVRLQLSGGNPLGNARINIRED